MIQKLSALESMPDAVFENILSYLGPTYGISCASKTLHSAHRRIVAQMGIVLAASAARTVWRTEKLPKPGVDVSQEQGVSISKMAILKVRAIWDQISENEKVQFKGYALSQISISPSLFRKLVHMDLELLQCLVPNHKQKPEEVSSTEFFERIASIKTSFRPVEHVPESIGCLTSLTHLCLDDMHLKRLPSSIGQLTSLVWLYVSNNELETLPPEIGNDKALQRLIFHHNRIETFPEAIGGLVRLEHIDASHNYISIIPESVRGLISLQSADFSCDLIQKSPYSIASLPSLQTLFLHDNPFQPEQKFRDSLRAKRTGGCLWDISPPSDKFSGLKTLWSKLAGFVKLLMGGLRGSVFSRF